MGTSVIEGSNRRTGEERRARADGALAAGLLAAFERGEIEVLFQPQYQAAGKVLLGAEALARWHHPEGPLIGGEQLFELAARAGRVAELSHFVAHAAIVAASAWRAPLRLSLNITPSDLAADDFVDRVRAMLDQSGFAAGRLTLEITEQSLVGDLASATVKLDGLARLGIHIALDDFGAGFCNFSYLKRLPLHAIKLDRSMILGIAEDPRDRAVLRGIMAMAQALNLHVIAEGVETEAQLAVISAEGCDAWQGFLGAAPLSASVFASLIA